MPMSPNTGIPTDPKLFLNYEPTESEVWFAAHKKTWDELRTRIERNYEAGIGLHMTPEEVAMMHLSLAGVDE